MGEANHDKVIENATRLGEIEKQYNQLSKSLHTVTMKLEEVRLKIVEIDTQLKTERQLEKRELTVRMWIVAFIVGLLFNLIDLFFRFFRR